MYNFSFYCRCPSSLLLWSIRCWYRWPADSQASTNNSRSCLIAAPKSSSADRFFWPRLHIKESHNKESIGIRSRQRTRYFTGHVRQTHLFAGFLSRYAFKSPWYFIGTSFDRSLYEIKLACFHLSPPKWLVKRILAVNENNWHPSLYSEKWRITAPHCKSW